MIVTFIQRIKSLTASLEPGWTAILVPFWQEFVFRYLPFNFFYISSVENFWLAGIISSVAFASIHWYFGRLFVLYAFSGGVILWWVIVNYGFAAAVFLHAVVNIVDITFGLRHYLTTRSR